jgi:hypothetical protein
MSTTRPRGDDPDAWDDEDEPAHFERVRKQTGKPTTAKSERAQQRKEWGKSISKFQRQRARENGPNRKP